MGQSHRRSIIEHRPIPKVDRVIDGVVRTEDILVWEFLLPVLYLSIFLLLDLKIFFLFYLSFNLHDRLNLVLMNFFLNLHNLDIFFLS